MPPKLTHEIITAAIDGYEAQKNRIDGKIAELKALLPGGSAETATTTEAPTHKRRKFSAAAIRRMKEAQQRRWAKVRGESEPPSPATAPVPKSKRKLSKAGRAAIVAALKKRWALKKAAAKKAVVKKASVKAPSAKAAKKKMSPERKAALVANLAKARAARAAKRTAA
jgi:hypothetical protein